jgi:tetratricopeptide (TPR) repeat protein
LTAQGQQLEDAISQLSRVRDVYRGTGQRCDLLWVLVDLAEAEGKLGQTEQALASITEASDLANQTEERARQSQLYRVKGDLLLTVSEDNQAETCFHEAIDVARRQSAKSYELRAATSLARLWQRQGRREEARELLAPVYG